MKTKKNKDFKAVDFMHKVRSVMTEKYLTNREKYFAELEELSERFLNKRNKMLHHRIA